MAQSSPMPRAIRGPRAASLRIFSMMASSFMNNDAGIKYESRGQLFAEDLTHRRKVACWFRSQIELRKRPPHEFQARRRAPHFAQEAGVYTWGLLRTARQQRGREALKHIGLLILVEASGDAAPKDPPLDFVLHLV